MQLQNYLARVDDLAHPSSLAYPFVVGVFACIAIIIVVLISLLDPYIALVACAFIFMVVLITANIRFYRRRKFALKMMAQVNGSPGMNTVHGEVCKKMSGSAKLEYLDSTEIHLPQTPTSKSAAPADDDDNGDGVVVNVKESEPYSMIDDIHLSKNPSSHFYLNFRKEAESDPEKDKLYINPRRSLVQKASMEGTDLVHKTSVKGTNLVQKNSVEGTNLVQKTSVKRTDLEQKTSMEGRDLEQKTSVKRTDLEQKNSVEGTDEKDEGTTQKDKEEHKEG
ncbi:hypothetical protein Pcinc_033212 [Petrolisthes cinctipes]|uniref:Uncharacterized protein n=1 Tax=Petrolisthes cinctipes TaxID=88211 RepID=A0AAE1ESQ1_PETCI|nr:hypothetical protein Pcinc_033212 [Petrolisthes cinctipes]